MDTLRQLENDLENRVRQNNPVIHDISEEAQETEQSLLYEIVE